MSNSDSMATNSKTTDKFGSKKKSTTSYLKITPEYFRYVPKRQHNILKNPATHFEK